MRRADKLIDLLVKTGMAEAEPEKIQFIVEEAKKLTIAMFSLYILKEAKAHQDCKPSECNVIEHIPEAVDNFLKEFEEEIRIGVELNLTVNGINVVKSHNQEVAEAIMKELDK